MKKEIIQKLHISFEDVAHEQDGVEFWLARDLQVLLGYDEWRNFTKVIEKAKESCKNAGQDPIYHFVEANKMIALGKGGQRSVNDFLAVVGVPANNTRRSEMPNPKRPYCLILIH